MNIYMNPINQSSAQSKTLLLLLSLAASPVLADDTRANAEETFDNCVLRQIHMDVEQDSLKQIKAMCEQDKTADLAKSNTRHELEKETAENPFVIMPYRQNYLLPITHMKAVNKNPYKSDVFGDSTDDLSNEEMKFQISFKVPLITDGIFNETDEMYFGFTLKSFWQAYSSEISAPFRDTNYRPEVFYETKLPIEAEDGFWFSRVGYEHESNGRTDELSRSWNRIYAGVGYEEENFMMYVEPWYNLGGMDSDNTDIEDYLSHYEVTAAYKYDELEFTSVGHYNFSTGYGGIEAGVSFPLLKHVRGYVQYFNGYGESLIDYDYHNQRIGVGILLTDII